MYDVLYDVLYVEFMARKVAAVVVSDFECEKGY